MKLHWIWDYLPTRYEASEQEWRVRRMVWNFKDGQSDPEIIEKLAQIIEGIAGGNKQNYVVCFIPASSESKTILRYANVAIQLERKTGVTTTIDAITRTSETTPNCCRAASDRQVDPATEFNFSSSYFRGKKVILIDDVVVATNPVSDVVVADGYEGEYQLDRNGNYTFNLYQNGSLVDSKSTIIEDMFVESSINAASIFIYDTCKHCTAICTSYLY